MANPAIFTAADKAEEGKIELKSDEYAGFAPNGQVIKISGKVKGLRESSSYFISGLELEDGTKYTWVKAENKFISKDGKVYPLLVNEAVSGKVPIWADSKNPACYVWYKFINVKNYTSKDFESIKRRIANDDGKNWHPDFVFGKSNDCMAKAQKEAQEGIELPQIRELVSNDINDTTDGIFDKVYFVGKASDFQASILAEIKQVFQKRKENTFTRKELSKDISIIISIDGDDSPEIGSLKNQKNSYLHLIFTIKNGKVEFLRMETSDKYGDKLSHICELIKNEPWAAQAIILYEVADLLDKGIEYLKIPESVWGCTGKDTLYKQVVAFLLESQISFSIADQMLGQRLSAESKFAFVCGLWNGTVEIVQSVPQLVKILTCVFHADCRESASSQWESFKNAVIEDESGHILCHQDEYFCKAKQMISIALSDLVADNCKVAHTVGSIVGPIAVTCLGDVAAGGALIARLGKVGSGLKYAIKGLQLCDKITDITRPLAKGLKVSAVLVKKVGKLLPEIRIEGNTILHYVGDKLHIRRFDAVTKQAIDEPIEESESVLIGKLEKQLRKAGNSVDKPSDAVVKPAIIADERGVSGESKTPSRSLSSELTALQKESVQRYQNLGLEQLVSFLEHPAYQQLSDINKTKFLKKLRGFEDNVLRELDADEQALNEFVNSLKADAKSEQAWFKRMMEGIRFNKERAKAYSFNEVYLEAPKKETKVAGDSPAKHKYVRLDSYDPQTGEIVSRKYTQLSEVSEETAIRYLKELEEKYAPGSIIANVPSNISKANAGIFKENKGNILDGQMILEVPVQHKAVPKEVINYANLKGIKIRDTNNHIYNK